MMKSLIELVIDFLNFFPSKNGLSKDMSPSTIVEGKTKVDLGIRRIHFGSYAMVCIGTQNNMKGRSIPAIALKPSNNARGQFIMSLYTEKIHSYIWEELPIDDGVIERVEELAFIEKQPAHIDDYPIFEWVPGIKIEDIQNEVDEVDETSVVHVAPLSVVYSTMYGPLKP